MKRSILVTGGTGFVGTALVRQLCEREYSVHVLARPGSNRAPHAGLPVTWHEGDLLDAKSVDRAVRAVCEAAGDEGAWLVHSAALISYRAGDRDKHEAVNVGGTRTVLEAALRHGVKRFLHVSSVVAVGLSLDGGTLDEESPFSGDLIPCDYTRTKRAAEELALAHARELDVRVVNPAAIFGPGEGESNTTRFLRSVARGKVGPVAPPGGLSVVGVHDTATGIRLALEVGQTGRRYLLAESYMTNLELFRLAAKKLDRRGPWFSMPRFLWPAVVAGARAIDWIRPLELATPQALSMLSAHFRFDSQRARTELGWEPAPFEKVLEETIAHYRERRLLD